MGIPIDRISPKEDHRMEQLTPILKALNFLSQDAGKAFLLAMASQPAEQLEKSAREAYVISTKDRT